MFSHGGSWHGEMSGARARCGVQCPGHQPMTGPSANQEPGFRGGDQSQGARDGGCRRPVKSRGIDPSMDQYLGPSGQQCSGQYQVITGAANSAVVSRNVSSLNFK